MVALNCPNIKAKKTLIRPKRPHPTIWKVQYLFSFNGI
jgi:hypothetical protein